MSSLRQFRSDIMLIYERLKLSKDKRLQERHVDFLIAKYRSVVIRDDYKANRQIDPAVLQDAGLVNFTRVLSSDDPAISFGNLELGKLTIPELVSLPDDRGIYIVSSLSKQCMHYPIEMNMFFDIPSGSWAAKSPYYFRVNTALYIYPARDEGNIVYILDNPMDGVVLLTENILSGSIQAGVSYTVQSGQVVYNGVGYNIGVAFVGVAGVTTFTGTGKVKRTIQKRAITEDDNYPMSFTMAERVLLKMFYQEFKIEETKFIDAKNDAADELTVLKSQ